MARTKRGVTEPPPALWRLAAASLIDAAPDFAVTLLPVYRMLNAAGPVLGTADEPDAEEEAFRVRALDGSRGAQAVRQARRGSLAYRWLKVAMICTFGRTQGMALFGLKVVRSGGASIGISGAFARAFGPNYLIRALTTPLRGAGPTAHGGALIALEAANAAVALLDPEHRTLSNRLARTRVVRG